MNFTRPGILRELLRGEPPWEPAGTEAERAAAEAAGGVQVPASRWPGEARSLPAPAAL